MNNYKQHKTFRIATILIVACLVLPSVVKFTHIFAHHEHEVCLGENQSHFHEIDMDCEFYKFNLNHNLFLESSNYELKISFDNNAYKTAYYTYLKSHQQLTEFLRGPPQFLM